MIFRVSIIKQLFCNNNYHFKVINGCINIFFNKLDIKNINNFENKQAIKLFYENQGNSNYQTD